MIYLNILSLNFMFTFFFINDEIKNFYEQYWGTFLHILSVVICLITLIFIFFWFKKHSVNKLALYYFFFYFLLLAIMIYFWKIQFFNFTYLWSVKSSVDSFSTFIFFQDPVLDKLLEQIFFNLNKYYVWDCDFSSNTSIT